jgi:hypothetical protein
MVNYAPIRHFAQVTSARTVWLDAIARRKAVPENKHPFFVTRASSDNCTYTAS